MSVYNVATMNNQLWDRLSKDPSQMVFTFCGEVSLAKLRTVCKAWQDHHKRIVEAEYGPGLVRFCLQNNIRVERVPIISPLRLLQMFASGSPFKERMSSSIMRFNGLKTNEVLDELAKKDEDISKILEDEDIFIGRPHIVIDVGPTRLLERLFLIKSSGKLVLTASQDAHKEPNIEGGYVSLTGPEFDTSDSDNREILSGTHPLYRIKGDTRRYESEASILAAVLTAATFALNWMLRA